MADLDDIWDEPVNSEPQRRRSPEADDDTDNIRSSKRRRATQPLFLDSDEDRDEGPSRGRLTQSHDTSEMPDIDHLFDGLDDDDDDMYKTQSLNAGPSVDKMRKDAEARAAARSRMRASSPITPHAVASSSPPRGDSRAKEGGDSKDKPRKKAMQLNASRLLGPDGFPALIQQTKGFKPKGKGHEVSCMPPFYDM
jgi:replication fork protection complex subunit Csm3/Swi3